MIRILVVANETVAGQALIDAVKKHGEKGDVKVHVICPQNAPKHGYVVYDTQIREAAENRLEMTLALLREAGLDAHREGMDPDPYAAVVAGLGDEDHAGIVGLTPSFPPHRALRPGSVC